jgi:bifunctional DNA-binding transcriptional regulator/antitoxin component of YhaV-PrlF toxin-antitoxin module
MPAAIFFVIFIHYNLKSVINRDKVMSMNNTITITRKGQTTLPAEIRRKLGVDSSGGELRIDFDERKGELVISKPTSISELSERVSRHLAQGTKPIVNVGEYYQTHREDRS